MELQELQDPLVQQELLELLGQLDHRELQVQQVHKDQSVLQD
jgi:hypothetical protein